MEELKIKSFYKLEKKHQRHEIKEGESNSVAAKSKAVLRFAAVLIIVTLIVITLYFLLQYLNPRAPKVYLSVYSPKTKNLEKATPEKINQQLGKEGKAEINIQIVAKAQYYRGAQGIDVPMDQVIVNFLDPDYRKIGAIMVPLNADEEKSTWEGEGQITLDPNNTATNVGEYISVMQTNKNRTADKFPVKVKIRQ